MYKSPLENLFHHKPDYLRLKTFGCLCHTHLRSFNKHKLEFRTNPGTFLRYSSKYKGYKVLLSNGKIIISKHIFHEYQFPYTTTSLSNQSHATSSQSQVPTISPPLVNIFFHEENQFEHLDTDLPTEVTSPHSLFLTSLAPVIRPSPSQTEFSLTTKLSTTNAMPTNITHSVTSSHSLLGTHHMVTQAKDGIFRPKAYYISIIDNHEPKSHKEALKHTE